MCRLHTNFLQIMDMDMKYDKFKKAQSVPYLTCLSLKRQQLIFKDNFPYKLKLGISNSVHYKFRFPVAVFIKVKKKSLADGVPPNTTLLVNFEDDELELFFIDSKYETVYTTT